MTRRGYNPETHGVALFVVRWPLRISEEMRDRLNRERRDGESRADQLRRLLAKALE